MPSPIPFRSRLRLFDSPYLFPLLLLLGGAVERLAWLVMRSDLSHAHGEAANAAIAYAKTGEIADVFGKGTGLTAHLNPILPAIGGTIYHIFGIQSTTSEVLLILMAIGFAMTSGWFLYLLFERLGVARWARLVALGIFCFFPINLSVEVVDFRLWEGAMAAALGAGTLLLIVKSDQEGDTGWRRASIIALLAALLFFINPANGLMIYFAAFILLVRRVPLRRWPQMLFITIMALICILTPWTLRNYEVFQRFIPLRGNMGLELALANHPDDPTQNGDFAQFRSRLETIHPLQGGGGFERLKRAGGELAYADAMGAEARRWIAANPGAFMRNCLSHIRQYYFPPEWQWRIYGDGTSRATWLKVAASWLLGITGLSGVLVDLLTRRGLYLYAACAVVLPVLPYIVTQPVPRYRYLVYGPLIFFSAVLLEWLAAKMRGWFRRGEQAPRDRPAASSPDAPSLPYQG